MSLFTGQDWGQVHILTQFTQLELPPSPEAPVEEWHESELGLWTRQRESGLAVRVPDRDEHDWRSHYDVMTKVYGVVKPILAAAADRSECPSEALAEFRDLYNERFQLVVLVNNPSGPAQHLWPYNLSRTPVPFDQIAIVEGGRSRSETLITELLWGLKHVLTRRLKVARCAQCDSPFIIAKRGQRYCSHRCSHREGERRRRGQRKGSVTLESVDVRS